VSAVSTVADVPCLQPSAARRVPNSEMSAATATHRAPLQYGRPLSWWRRSCDFVSATNGLEDLQVVLKMLPGDIAGMGVRDAGEPVVAFALSEYFLAVGGSPIMAPAVDVGAGIARIVQRSDRGRYGQRLENGQLLVADARWKANSLMAKHFHRLEGGAHPRERLEKIGDGLPDADSDEAARV